MSPISTNLAAGSARAWAEAPLPAKAGDVVGLTASAHLTTAGRSPAPYSLASLSPEGGLHSVVYAATGSDVAEKTGASPTKKVWDYIKKNGLQDKAKKT